jgi:hypothetical protein
MSTDLNQALAEILIGVTETAEQAKDFVIAEMPDVVQQLLLWKMAESIVVNVVSLLVILLLVMFWRWVWKNKNAEWTKAPKLYDSTALSDGWVGLIIGGTTVTVFIVLLCAHFLNLVWLQIWLAPKVYLIEYSAKLVGM